MTWNISTTSENISNLEFRLPKRNPHFKNISPLRAAFVLICVDEGAAGRKCVGAPSKPEGRQIVLGAGLSDVSWR